MSLAPLPVLFARSRGGFVPPAVVVVASVLVVGWAPVGLRRVPLMDHVALVALGVSAVLPAFGCLRGLGAPGPEIERPAAGWRLVACRLAWTLLLSALVVVTGVTVAVARGLGLDGAVLVARNGIIGTGIVLVCAVLLRPALAWVPLSLFALVGWIFGTTDLAGTARWWAVLSHTPDSRSAAVVAVLLWCGGCALYVTRDARAG